MARRRITEYLVADLDENRWRCHACGADIGDLNDNYKHGCQVRARHPYDIHDPMVEGEFTMAPDPEWCRIVEYYCPGCYTLIEAEYLPPGFPPMHDIALDVDALRRKADAESPTGDSRAEVTAA